MHEKKVLIIGAGTAGLSAGIYALLNGYQAEIFELHTLPGGLCTAWERQGYTFDGCIHYLFGSGEGRPFNQMWRELGAVQNRPMVNHSEYQRITDGEQTLTVYADPDQLEAHMIELSPQDAGLIRDFCEGVRAFTHFDMYALYNKPRSHYDALDWREFGSKMTPFLPHMMRWATLASKDFAARFRSPFLQRAVTQMFSWEEAPVMMGMFLLAYLHTGNAGFPRGGSLAFARAIEARFLALGGQIHYNAQVEKILTRDGRAYALRLYNDEIHEGDLIISAADGRSTIFSMLDGQYVDRSVKRRYDGHLKTHTQVQVSLGVNRDMSAEPHWVTHMLPDPVLVIGEARAELGVKHYCFDPSLAPAGKSSMIMMMRSSYDYWQRIYGRRLYDSEQRQVSSIFIDLLEERYPGIAACVEHRDEATPLSYERYTNNWMGSTCGFLLTKDSMPMLINGVPKTLPGLKNFYMAGHWVEPGGTVTLAAASGRAAIQMICHEDGKAFEAAEP